MLSKMIGPAALALAVALSSPASAEILRAETAGAGGFAHTVMIVTAKYAKQQFGIDLQVADGQKLVMSMLKSGQGKVDVYSGYPPAFEYMKAGTEMYKPVAEQAMGAAGNLRAMFSYPAGMYAPVAFADSGIATWQDFKGRRILTGPAAGAATKDNEEIIEAMTGYKAGVDYEAVNLEWGQGEQAMRDGQIDVMMKPAQPGTASLQELAISRPIRIFGFSDADIAGNAALEAITKKPAVTIGVMPKGSFENQVNNDEDLKLVAYVLMQGTHKDVPEDVVYKLTKAFWDNLDEEQKSIPALKQVRRDLAFVSLEMPLHVGAYKYYKENGFDVPEKLIPPEAE